MSRVVLAEYLNGRLAGYTPGSAFLAGAIFAIVAPRVLGSLSRGRLASRLKTGVVQFVLRVAAAKVKKEVEKVVATFSFRVAEEKAIECLPEKGIDQETVASRAIALHKALDDDYFSGGLSGTVYHGGVEWTAFINKVMDAYQWTNPLHVDFFPALRKMEAEIVAMVVAMYKGSAATGECGSITTGGTESIMMAIKVYKEFARASKGITKPNMVFPITCHPAFDKACEYFGIEAIKVPVSAATGRVDPVELEKFINYNTIAIAGSAPCYPYGTIDPLEALSDIALRHNVGMHVDACLGGFVVPFMEKAGVKNAPIADFRLKGVTTISCDTHKFGYAPKGTSVVMYRNQELRGYQFFSLADWPGGLYASPSAPGSKPGNAIAGTWAAMIALGEEGYVQATKEIQDTLWRIRDGLVKIPSIYILGNPTVCSVGFDSSEVDIDAIADRLKARGWFLNPLQNPNGLLFSLTLLHSRLNVADRFLRDVEEVTRDLIKELKEREARGEKVKRSHGGTMYGGQQKVADTSVMQYVTRRFFDVYYNTNPPAKPPLKPIPAA